MQQIDNRPPHRGGCRAPAWAASQPDHKADLHLAAPEFFQFQVLGRNYYYFGRDFTTWNNASNVCKSKGWVLATVDSEELQAGMLKQVFDVSYTLFCCRGMWKFFVGANNLVGKDGDLGWGWLDSTPWGRYSDWMGQTVVDSLDCYGLAVYGMNPSGSMLWMPEPCDGSGEKHPFVCAGEAPEAD
jgi:hypothetical protein